jgi:cbb3-type cytochrome oxidase maturation protein
MTSLLVLIPVSLLLLGLAVLTLVWAIRDGQYDDLDSPSIAVLAEDAGIPRGTRGQRQ